MKIPNHPVFPHTPDPDEAMDKERADNLIDEDERFGLEKCRCRFCYCSVKTDRGVCDMCASGAHQG